MDSRRSAPASRGAAAGIIVGVISLTAQGLKLSSLVLRLSMNIKAIAILIIGAASLVLGMGLPVTASCIVLATLAGPALMDLGVPLRRDLPHGVVAQARDAALDGMEGLLAGRCPPSLER